MSPPLIRQMAEFTGDQKGIIPIKKKLEIMANFKSFIDSIEVYFIYLAAIYFYVVCFI